ncbi:FecR family protein [Chitinophaga cymbidii]|nr:FecR family protein [Chitinophaga cymbidii]
MKQQELKILLDKYLDGQPLSEEEQAQLAQWDTRFDGEQGLLEQLTDVEKEHLQQRIWQNVALAAAPGTQGHRPRYRRMIRYAAAAAILLLLGIGGGWLLLTDRQEAPELDSHHISPEQIWPGTKTPTLTLADGRSIRLDSLKQGELTREGAVQVVKEEDGQITYKPGKDAGDQLLQYNTLSNPRGSKVVQIMLADGTAVWLNAGSAVTYPTAFTGKERRVRITGEAYFEVKPDKKRPFIVSYNEYTAVHVLGTRFNVNGYEDEPDVRVTLLEGSVLVHHRNEQLRLRPGEQARIGTTLSLAGNVNTDEVMAWKNGYFSFNGTDIRVLMRQIARWYDVDVVYEGNVREMRFGGEMPRNTSLAQVLEMLRTSGVNCKMDGRQLIINQNRF